MTEAVLATPDEPLTGRWDAKPWESPNVMYSARPGATYTDATTLSR